MIEKVAFRPAAPKPDERCWRYRDGCRNHATDTVRIGDSVYHYCDNRDHNPQLWRVGQGHLVPPR